MNRRGVALLAALFPILLGGCVELFEIEVSSRTAEAVVVELSQYHSPGFDGNRPRAFTPDLLVRRELLALSGGGSRTINFDSGAGGYWLQWRVVQPEARADEGGTLELVRGENTITIGRVR